MLVRLIPPVGAISSLINTTPIVAMLIPATKEVQQRAGIPARSVLLPVAHATTLAGSTTLVGTSSNLIIAGFATSAGVHLSMFSFVPIALPVALVGWVALVLLSRHLLRGRSRHKTAPLDWRAEIPVSGKAVGIGRTATSMGMHKTAEFELVEIRRWGQPVDIDSPIEGGDLLVYRTTELGVQMLWESPRFGLAPLHLFAVTIGTENPGTVRDLQDEEDLLVVAAQTHHRSGTRPQNPAACAMCSSRRARCWKSMNSSACGRTWQARLRNRERRGSRYRSWWGDPPPASVHGRVSPPDAVRR